MKSIPNEREYYLADIPLKEAIDKFDDALHRHHRKNSMESEHVSLSKSVGRVVSKTIYAKLSSPLANTAAMDGIAVKSSLTVGATESAPVTLIAGRDFQWVDTGDAMPDGVDSVVMVEDVGKLED
nr:molybdopterin biosynthesis protein [Dehalococcoidia bacterium]